MVRTLLRSEGQRSQSLVDVVRHCNHVLFEDFSNTSMFATLLLGVLDPEYGTFSYLNCGHCEPLLLRGADDDWELLTGDGLPLGILEEFDITERAVQLPPGSVLVIYSDGFSEAKAPSGEMFGVERLRQAIQESVGNQAETILGDIESAIDRFVVKEPQSDDQTIVIVRATA